MVRGMLPSLCRIPASPTPIAWLPGSVEPACSASPSQRPAEEFCQTFIVWGVVVLECGSCPGPHGQAWPRVMAAKARRLEGVQAQERQQVPVLLARLLEVCLALHDVHLTPREQVERALQLVRVVTTVAVGVMAVRVALVRRI